MYVTDLNSLNGNYVWCIGCNRAYKKTNMKWNPEWENYECKHDDCNFRMKGSFWPYDVYRRIFGWPKIPIEGKKYQMMGNQQEAHRPGKEDDIPLGSAENFKLTGTSL